MHVWPKKRLRRHYVLADVIIFVYEVPCVFWHYINVDEVIWITLKKLLQSAMELLQIATGITKCDGFITNCDRYYKVRWLLQIATVQTRVKCQSAFDQLGTAGHVCKRIHVVLDRTAGSSFCFQPKQNVGNPTLWKTPSFLSFSPLAASGANHMQALEKKNS